MQNILVIGASGFVGSYLARQLLTEGYQVRCLARDPGKIKSFADSGCEIVKGDITDLSSVEQALESIDAVYVSIQTLVPQRAETKGQGFMDIELKGLQNIVGGCQKNGVGRLIYVTSIGVSADSKDAWTAGRWNVQQYLLGCGLDVTIIQPGMIVGKGGQGFNMVLANAQKTTAFVIGNGRNRFRCVAIDDLTYNLIGILEEPRAYGKCYEVGGDDILTSDELIDMAADIVGHPHPSKIHIPLGLIRFVAPLIQLLAKTPKGAIQGAMDSLGQDMIGNPTAIRDLLPRPPVPYREAVSRALKQP